MQWRNIVIVRWLKLWNVVNSTCSNNGRSLTASTSRSFPMMPCGDRSSRQHKPANITCNWLLVRVLTETKQTNLMTRTFYNESWQLNWNFMTVCFWRNVYPSRPHRITGLVRPSRPNSKNVDKAQKNRICVNVPRDRSRLSANFQFKRSKVTWSPDVTSKSSRKWRISCATCLIIYSRRLERRLHTSGVGRVYA